MWIERVRGWLGVPVDWASLVFFRVAFGLVVLWEMARYYDRGWIAQYWIKPEILFPYVPFTFVKPWPEPWMMYAHVAVVALAAVGVALGWRYRLSAAVLWTGFTWLFMLDQTRYLNHFYLISLVSFILMWLPLDRVGSLDVRAGRVEPLDEVPAWSLYWVRFMVAVPYFFGGVAKMTTDWIGGFPMREWLADAAGHPFVGAFHETELAVAVFVWGGLLFDLLIMPLMLWPRGRVFGLGLMLAFHLSNAWMFEIGIFPWMMIALTLVMLPPEWPRRLWADLREGGSRTFAIGLGAFVGFTTANHITEEPSAVEAVIAAIGVGVFFWEVVAYGWDWKAERTEEARVKTAFPVGGPGFALGMAFVVVQVLLPLRHFLIPGNVHWTEEGHRWSWHMLLRDKTLEDIVFVVDPPGDTPPFEVDPRKHLLRHQVRKVAFHPGMNVRFARYLVDRYDVPGAAVYVRAHIMLNGRKAAPMIDPNRDLTRVAVPWFGGADWILPLTEPLPAIATAGESHADRR